MRFLLFILIYFLPISLFASLTTEVPIVNQMQVFQKILAMERTIASSTAKEINIGIIYQEDNKISNATKKEIINFIQNKTIKVSGKTLKFIPINLTASKDIAKTINLSKQKLDVFMITQLRSVNYGTIRLFAMENSILTYSTSSDIMENYKFSLSVGYKSNNIQILVNNKQLSDEGYVFSSSFLEYAKIVK